MAQVHDPTYQVRRALWLAYGVLAVGLILLVVAIFMIRSGQSNFPATKPPTGLAPNSSPTATPSPNADAAPPGATPGGEAQAAGPTAPPSGSSGPPPSGYPRGEPPGDVEDDTLINPYVAPLPKLPVPLPSVSGVLPGPSS